MRESPPFIIDLAMTMLGRLGYQSGVQTSAANCPLADDNVLLCSGAIAAASAHALILPRSRSSGFDLLKEAAEWVPMRLLPFESQLESQAAPGIAITESFCLEHPSTYSFQNQQLRLSM